MDRVTTSPKPRRSLKKIKGKEVKYVTLREDAKVNEHDPLKRLLDENFIAGAIWECLKSNDAEGVMEVINIHLEAKNKFAESKKSNLQRSTLYNALKNKNPTIKTLAKMVNCCL